MPFGFHLAMDTLPSADQTSLCGQRGITPAFGYGTPHLSARGTSTLLNNALLSAQYGAVRTPPKRTSPDHGSFTFPDRSARADALEVSRISCTLLADVPGLFDYAEPSGHSRNNAAR